MSNNSYPQNLVKMAIDKRLGNISVPSDESDTEKVCFFVKLDCVSTFTDDTRRLRGLIVKHVVARRPNDKVELTTYYRPYKLASCFSTRSRPCDADRSGVVYRYTCNEISCNDIYYGYTTQRLSTRAQQHRYGGSSIREHFITDHDKLPPKLVDFLPNFEVIYSHEDTLNLRIAEAILIKNDKPVINVKYNELYDFLKLF